MDQGNDSRVDLTLTSPFPQMDFEKDSQRHKLNGDSLRRDPQLKGPTVSAIVSHAFWVGLGVRLFLAWFLPWALDDGGILPGVSYTDIDYHVFMDAATYIQKGSSPYDRTTYRYTPFLAALLSHLPRKGGRFLICVADALCGQLIVTMRRKQRNLTSNESSMAASWPKRLDLNLEDVLWWLFNPLAINICTRGSAESLIVLLPVLITVWIVTSGGNSLAIATLAGCWHGIAVHAKLYPIIYSLSFLTHIAVSYDGPSAVHLPVPSSISHISGYVHGWKRRLLRPAPVLFGVCSIGVFAGLTYLSLLWYGQKAIDEGLLYHFVRVDHRHNYSMHWYWIYLGRSTEDESMALAGRLLLITQTVLLITTSVMVAPRNLTLAMFVQTFLFVAHNKVITAQYFTWYLCLLPLCSASFRLTRRVVEALAILLVSVGFWLGSAYSLEMLGFGFHRIVWMASLIFFAANVHLLRALLASAQLHSSTPVYSFTVKKD
jgi:phosphatidylinositol glycan class M